MMYVGDHPSHNFDHPDPGPRTELAGDVVPMKIQPAPNTGPSALTRRDQAVKILTAPGTGNVYGISGQFIK